MKVNLQIHKAWPPDLASCRGPAPKRTLHHFTIRTKTTMPIPHLPVELLEHVVNHLHNTKHALRNCCLVSKSWVPRTRKHLFASVAFYDKEDLKKWKETFPNPSTSPAPCTETLIVHCVHAATAADAEPGGWIRAFSCVVHFELDFYDGRRDSLLPFHGFSPVLKSIHVELDFPPLTLDFILSFPLLEDLTVNFYGMGIDDGDGYDGLPTVIQPSNPPIFPGSLELAITGLKPFIRQLSSLPSGIHFRKITVRLFHDGDILLTVALVERCSHTLESLNIYCSTASVSIQRLRPY